MGAELIRKYVTSSMIICYRSVVRHPFLMGMIVFMFLMYRLFPLLFSILVSASPVLVSTAVLLGTLLSLGQPNIPGIEIEPEPKRAEIRKLESNGSRIEVADRSIEEMGKIDKVDDNCCVEGDRPVHLVDDGLVQFGEGKSEKDEERVVLGSRYSPLQQSEDEHIVLESDKLWEGSTDPLNSNSGLFWKGVEGNGRGVHDDDEDDDDDDDGSESGDLGSDLAESSSPDASMADIIPMLDELHPLLSEDKVTHEPSHISHDGTDAVSEHSLESSDTSSESNDDTGIENQENLKIGDEDKEPEHVDKEDDTTSAITWTEDDQKNLMDLGTSELERNRHLENLIARRRAQKIGDDEDDDTESEHIDKEDETRSAITWTEDDQKNLMDLGTSELERNRHLESLIARRRAQKIGDGEDDDTESEHIDKEDDTRSAITWTEDDQKNLMNLGTSEMERNRRLENLIARRRARKAMRMQAERNLTDLESADLPWNIPPISTSRNNPFDYDSNDNIPGSAPSVLSQRRNPFDLPYDSSEEKPDLVGDTFEQEFAVLQPKDPIFRRYESFNVGPSVFATSRSERQESKLKPYFVPERSFSTFQRQFSGLSDSKVSSVPDTESASSDPENKDNTEDDERSLEAEHASETEDHASVHVSHGRPYFVPEHVASGETSFPSFQRQISEVSDSKVSSEDTESVSSAGDLENKDHIDLSQEPDLISMEDHEHASEMIEHASEHVSPVSESFEEDGIVEPRGFDEADISIESVTNRQELHSSGSSLSSLDEASEQIYNEKEGDEVVTGLVPETNYFLDRSSLIERSETDVSSLLVEASQPNEPVYDLSPQSSSIYIDLHKDESFQHTDDHNQSSSSASDVKWNSPGSSSEIRDAQNQLPVVRDNEEHVLAVDNISTSLLNKPILEAEDVVSDLDASRELEEVQVSSSNSDARSHESSHQEDVMSQPVEVSLLGRSSDKPLVEDPELQGEVYFPSHEPQFNEFVHGETYENHKPTHGEDVSQPQEEFPLLNMSVREPSEENPEVLLVQITSNNLDNLQIQEPDVVEVTDIETKPQEVPAYASDSYSIENNIDDVDEIKEIDEDLLVELDAVGDFSVNDFGSTLNEMKEDPHTSEHDLENKGISDEDSYDNDLESKLSEMKQYPHVLEHDLETNHSEDEFSHSKDLGSTFNEMKQEHDVETKYSEDEDSDSKNLGTALDERKQDPCVLDHDLETTISGDEDSFSKLLGSALDEMKQDPHASDHNLETKHSEEMKQETPARDHDIETKHSEAGGSYSKDATLDELKQDPHDSNHDLETKHTEDDDSYSKVATLLEMKQDPHDSNHDLEAKHAEEMKQDQPASDHDLETKHSEDEDSSSKDGTLDETKQDPHDPSHDLEAKHSEEMKQDQPVSDYDLDSKHSEDVDSYSKDATLDEMKQDPHDSNHDLEAKHPEEKQDQPASYHDLETKHSEDEDSYSKDTTLDVMKQDPHDSNLDLETKQSGDEDSYSKDVGSNLDEMKHDPLALDHDLESNLLIDEDSYSKDLDATFNEMKQGTHALEHRLETFYSVDDNFYSQHIESTFNEMKQDLQVSDQDLQTNLSGVTKIEMDAEAIMSQNENDVSNTKIEGAFQAEAPKSKLTSDAIEVVLPQETETTTSFANSASATMDNHGTENASSASKTDN